MTFFASFTIDGIPKPQPRSRATIRGKHAGVYDPGTAADWKVCVAAAGREFRPASPLTGAVEIEVSLRLPRPKRLSRKKDYPGEVWAATDRGDVDNHAKAVMDCLTADGWWVDDRQVVRLVVEKRYHSIGERPGAVIAVREVAYA